MADFSNLKDCSTCSKATVCKYYEKRDELLEKLQEVAREFKEDIFKVSLCCNEHHSNISTR